MQFSDSYFEDEIRDGFYVPGMMKRAWAAQLEILAEIDKVCKKYNIQYFADWGTLLGAVRHGGFIPWDDDLDICMKRADYQNFLKVAVKELPSEYRLLNFHTACDGEYMWQFITRVINRREICFEKEHLDKFHGFPFMAGIDIYPLDYRAPDDEEEKLRSNLAMLVMHAIQLQDQNDGEAEKQLRVIEEMCNTRIDRNGMVKQQLYCLAEQLLSLYQEKDARIITRMVGEKDESCCRYPKSYYQDSVLLPFENIKIPVPLYYDAILKSLYGEYWRPVHGGGVHDYPFYKKQKALLPSNMGSVINHED